MNNLPFLVNIDSDDRINGTNTNFEIEIDNLRNVIGRPCKMVPINLEICIGCVYQIQTGKNTFVFSVDGTSSISFDITPGTYTVTSLTALLKTQMEALDGVANTYVFSFNQDTNIIGLTATYASGTFELRNLLNSPEINDILGLDNSALTNTTITSGTTFNFPLQCDMYPRYNFFICSDIITSSNISSGNNNFENAFLKIRLHTRFARMNWTYQDTETYEQFVSSFRTRMRFWVVDDKGNDIIIPPNLKTSMTLKFYPL
jgi:hypothetical protein